MCERAGCVKSPLIRLKPNPTTQEWEQIDQQLSRSLVLNAVRIYVEATGCGIAQAKDAIGARLRERYPQLWRNYRNTPEHE